jgi:hypothetical protein
VHTALQSVLADSKYKKLDFFKELEAAVVGKTAAAASAKK